MRVLSISYGRHLFEAGNGECARIVACSHDLDAHHMIVFTRRSDALSVTPVSEKLILYPTNSYFRMGMVLDAIWIGLRIVWKERASDWCISAQDPFAAGVVGLALRWMTRKKLLVQEHGDFFGAHWRLESRGHRVWYWIGRTVIRHADRVRVVALRVHAHVRQLGVPSERIVTLPVYSDLAHFRDALPSTDLHALHTQASLIVLSVARFVPQKNLPLLIQAFARLRAHTADAHLVIVGRGEEEQKIRELIAHKKLNDAVSVMPWSTDVASLMKTADIFALSSNYEGWGRVLLEAMACGTPSVATEVGCVGELFEHEKHGLVVPVGDTDAFGNALVRLADDAALRTRLGAEGRERSKELFQSLDAYREAWTRVHIW